MKSTMYKLVQIIDTHSCSLEMLTNLWVITLFIYHNQARI